MSLPGLRVLVAPDSSKGSATSYEAASAIASGWLRIRPGDTVQLTPMADGGEGTLDVSGITLLSELVPDAHTVGFGQAIAAALDFGVQGLILGIGGSCSTDGGTGALSA